MVIIVDTREHEGKFGHITRYFDKIGVAWERGKLDFGDYAIKGYEKKAVIERKASLDELAGNFTKGRERFKREFIRASEADAKVVLMIERCSGYEDIMAHKYRSRFLPTSYYASLKSWEEKYGLEIRFISRPTCSSGKFIYDKLRELNGFE